MFARANRATLVLFVASVLMVVVAVVLVSQPLSRAAAQQDDDGPKDMQELCQYLAEQDDDLEIGLGWTNGNTNSPIGYAYHIFSPEEIYWCGADFMCFDRPWEGIDGDMCLPYSAIHQIYFPDGAFGD
ncbi:MAG: hypothetical protein SF123_09770 [Chloroflexota bacterium]|nr:hypothetical protein [Chloroflexota bacterium]